MKQKQVEDLIAALGGMTVIGSEIYAADDGNDLTAVIGSPSRPYTLQGALNVASFNDVIIIKRGIYTGDVSIPTLLGAGVVNWESKIIYIYAMEGAVIEGQWLDSNASGANYSSTLWIAGSGAFNATDKSLFETAVRSNGMHVVIKGARKVTTSGTTTPSAIFKTTLPVVIENVDELVSVAEIGMGIGAIAISSIPGTIKNCRVVSAINMFQCESGGETLNLIDIDSVSCAQIVYNDNASGAKNYLATSIRNILKFTITSAFCDAYLGRVEDLQNVNFTFTNTTDFIQLGRPSGATDGTGYFLKMKSCHVIMADTSKKVVTSSDIKIIYASGVTSNAITFSDGFIDNDEITYKSVNQYYFSSDLFTEQATSFRGLISDISQYITDELASIAFEVRLDTVSSWTSQADLTALQSWINSNITGDQYSGTIFWIKILATYKSGRTGEAEARLTYTAR